jgi:hypothetical protein
MQFRGIAAGAVMAAVAACAPVSHVQTTGDARLPTSVRLIVAPPDGQPDNDRLARFAVMLGDALARSGVTVSDQGAYGLTITMAQRPGSIGITQERLTDKPPSGWLSAPSPKHLLQFCRNQITRIGIVGQNSSGGQVGIAAQGELDGCGNTDARLAQLADDLAVRLTQGWQAN